MADTISTYAAAWTTIFLAGLARLATITSVVAAVLGAVLGAVILILALIGFAVAIEIAVA